MKSKKTNVLKRRRLFAIAPAAVIGFALALAAIACDDGNNNGETTLVSITAEYVPTTEIFPDTAHDTLKEGLTVKAQYSDSTDKTLNDADYTLRGALTVGESVITVSYTEGGVTKTATFKITVDPLTHEHNWQFKKEITPATCTDTGEEQWECDAITPAHHEDRETAALGHDWEWVVDSPSSGIDTQICSRDDSHIGETRFTTVAAMTTFLQSQPANTAATPYNIKLNVATMPWINSGQAQTAFGGNGGKFVNLDLSGSTFTSISSNAFYQCTSLTGVTIPASVTSIANSGSSPNGAFSSCTNLTSVTFAEGSQLTAIGNYAFYQCTSLTDITIPSGVTSIGREAFLNCSSLTGTLTIPEGVTSIGLQTFRGCTGLTGITIPSGVTSIGQGAFYNCRSLTGTLTIPEGVTSIDQNTFYGCTGLTGITIPANVTTIGISAFYGCTGLTSITIPNSVTTIGEQAFYGCSGLTGTLTIPSSVTTIGQFAFSGCAGLTGITIPASVTSIGASAFASCTNLTSVTFAGTIPSTGWTYASAFPGDLRTKFYAGDSDNGVPGTYIVTSGTGTSKVWTKQPS